MAQAVVYSPIKDTHAALAVSEHDQSRHRSEHFQILIVFNTSQISLPRLTCLLQSIVGM